MIFKLPEPKKNRIKIVCHPNAMDKIFGDCKLLERDLNNIPSIQYKLYDYEIEDIVVLFVVSPLMKEDRAYIIPSDEEFKESLYRAFPHLANELKL